MRRLATGAGPITAMLCAAAIVGCGDSSGGDGGIDGSADMTMHDSGHDSGGDMAMADMTMADMTMVDMPPGMDAGPPTAPPTMVTMITNTGFTSPTDAVASPDGATFYFAAVTPAGLPAIFSVASTAGSLVTVMAMGGALEYPTGLAISCDGSTLYIADSAATGSITTTADNGSIFSMPTTGTATPTAIGITGMASPQGIAMSTDCTTLYITGRNSTTGLPGVYSVAPSGGAVAPISEGAPLVAPTGVSADPSGTTVWVLDHLARGTMGMQGVLFTISPPATAAAVRAEGFALGAPGGLAITPGGGSAVIASRTGAGVGQLSTVVLSSGVSAAVAAAMITDPAGIHTARNVGIYAVVDSEGGAIFRAE